ncbi:MAG: DUF4105 domain-containing protein [Salinivirgaceae bacterium]|nr:DUF4105 domain-containing protein [Salinivirgaceae bacterium]
MKKILIISLVATLFTSIAAAQPVQLSERSYIEVYTCAPGNQLYSQFGHTAIGVIDPRQNLHEVFNYGTFSFNTPHFYLKFCAGKLLYQLTTEAFNQFTYTYERRGRQVVAQRLNLTLAQRQHLYEMLEENSLPENCDYQYDFFFDNCATRVLDMLYRAFGDSLCYIGTDTVQLPTMRDCIHPYLDRSLWTKAGIDLVLGSITDRRASNRQQSFIPDKLHDYLAECQIDTLPLVSDSRLLVESTIEYDKTPWFLSPMLIFSLLLIVVVVLTFRLSATALVIFDRIYFSIIGLLGILITLLWFATDHGATVGNLNMLWASPLFLVYVFTIGNTEKQWHKWLRIILIAGNGIMIFGFLLPQSFNLCFYPLIVASLVRLVVTNKTQLR